jgi:hypothetical protein
MSDAIASDHFIISPAVVLEQQLFSMRLELEQIKNAVARQSDYELIRGQKTQIREIARLAAETVQVLNMREVR